MGALVVVIQGILHAFVHKLPAAVEFCVAGNFAAALLVLEFRMFGIDPGIEHRDQHALAPYRSHGVISAPASQRTRF